MIKKIGVIILSTSLFLTAIPSIFINLDFPNGLVQEINAASNEEVSTDDSNINKQNKGSTTGFIAKIKSTNISLVGDKLSIFTESSFDRWSYVSQISQFTDKEGKLSFAYTDDSFLYIVTLNSDKSIKKTIKINKKYPEMGGVACDTDGYYYVVWGKPDDSGKGGVTTAAISKYTSTGSIVKTTNFTTSLQDENGSSWDTRYPFDFGNCAIAIKDGILVCSYGRVMYNGHQSNAVIAVYTSDMKKCDKYDSYASHSFDQRVVFDSNKDVWFANHGDAYPRGFGVTYSPENKSNFSKDYVPFHFYAEASAMNDMYVLNETKAQLGGIAATKNGVVLIGSSVKGMTESTYNTQKKNLFITYVDGSKKMPNSTSRTGTCLGENVTDTGIKWLTDYSDGSYVNNPQIAYTDDDKIVILWEKMDKNGDFIQSYYMILSSNGEVLRKKVPMNKIRLNANEEPIYSDGYVNWLTANGNKAKVHSLDINSVEKESNNIVVSDKTKTLGDRDFNLNVTVKDGAKLTYKSSNTKVATIDSKGNVTIKGTGKTNITILAAETSNYKATEKTITITVKPSKVVGVKSTSNSYKSNKIKWSSTLKSHGYEIYRASSKTGSYTKIKTITSPTTLNYIDTGLTTGKTYYYKVRAYVTVDNKKIYGEFSNIVSSSPKLTSPTVTLSSKNRKAYIKWSKISGASGYKIYRSTSKSGTYSKVKTVTSGSTTSYTNSNLTKNKVYYYKVRAYRTVSGKNVYSDYSSVKYIKVK